MNKKLELTILLNEEDFACLVRGGILTIEDKDSDINIILKNIGFDQMDEAISRADQKIDIYKNHKRKNNEYN